MSASKGLYDFPIAKPPPGVTPNFEHPTSIAYRLNITGGVCIGLVLVFYAFRVYANFTGISKQDKWWKHAILALAVILVVVYTSLWIIIDSFPGIYGVHEYEILLQNFVVKTPLVLLSTFDTMFPAAIYCIKLSLTIFYLDIFGRFRWFRWSCYGLMTVLAMFYLTYAISLTILCTPRHDHSWIGYVLAFSSKKCKRGRSFDISIGVVNLISDLFLLILPLPALWSLNMPTKKKIGISVMFLTGLTAVIASVIALLYRLRTIRDWSDATWWSIGSSSASIAELTAGFMVVCMPSVAAVFRNTNKSGVQFGLPSTWSTRSWRRVYSSSKTTNKLSAASNLPSSHGSTESPSFGTKEVDKLYLVSQVELESVTPRDSDSGRMEIHNEVAYSVSHRNAV